MDWREGLRQPGVAAALGAAVLFGVGTPLAKGLLAGVNPYLLAGLLYLGSGIGLSLYRRWKKAPAVRISPREAAWFAAAILSGGVAGPVLLMIGLSGMSASAASLLLNAECVFTTLIAWFAFKENFDRRLALGMAAIVAAAAILSWSGEARFAELWPTLSILGACAAWGIDNNLTRRIALTDAIWIAAQKGLVAGSINLLLAYSQGASLPGLPHLAGAMLVGVFAYGLSLTLFVTALRHLGTARAGAYFAVAPFFGAALALLMGEPITAPLLIAGALMALGTWLYLTESHVHEHSHETTEHEHEHVHDDHHQHHHELTLSVRTKHSHAHWHQPQRHRHPHFPDAHHRKHSHR